MGFINALDTINTSSPAVAQDQEPFFTSPNSPYKMFQSWNVSLGMCFVRAKRNGLVGVVFALWFTGIEGILSWFG